MKTHSEIKSKNHDFFIKILGQDEPNYGRLLWRVETHHNNHDITEKLLGNWNYLLNIDLSTLIIDSNDQKYIYIPSESDFIIFNPETLSVDKFRPKFEIGDIIGNYFINEFLVVFGKKSIYKINLTTQEHNQISFGEFKRANKINNIENNQINFEYLEIERKGVVEYITNRGLETITI